MSMECHEVHDLVAGWLDDELSPGQAELMAQHLERCEACAELVARLDGQDLRPPPAPDTEAPGFWAAMDARLAAEHEAVLAERARPAPPTPAWRRELRLRPPQVLALAAVMLLSLGVAGLQSWRASQARAEVAALQSELDRRERLDARPDQLLPVEAYQVSVHTPYRGSL